MNIHFPFPSANVWCSHILSQFIHILPYCRAHFSPKVVSFPPPLLPPAEALFPPIPSGECFAPQLIWIPPSLCGRRIIQSSGISNSAEKVGRLNPEWECIASTVLWVHPTPGPEVPQTFLVYKQCLKAGCFLLGISVDGNYHSQNQCHAIYKNISYLISNLCIVYHYYTI